MDVTKWLGGGGGGVVILNLKDIHLSPTTVLMKKPHLNPK